MPRRQYQVVGNLQFKTKKKCKEYTADLIKRKGVGEIDKVDRDFLFFKCLYSRKPSHSDSENNIQKFIIEVNPNNKKADYLSIIDNNGKKCVFSWVKCVNACDASNKEMLYEAFRTSIEEQTSDFYYKNHCCNHCGKEKINYKLVVDHVNEFNELREDFINKTPLKIPDSFDNDSNSKYIFKKKDYIFKEEFQEYHKKHAILQLLCEECHKNKTINYITGRTQ